jgi:septum site-determining protein MinD
MNKNKQTIINIVSGKGGTGKTLLACVLADMLGELPESKTIVIDLDFFVRGLTSLLYFHHEEKLHIVPKNQLTVSSFFLEENISNKNYSLAIVKYRSFDVTPAVFRIDELLDFRNISSYSHQKTVFILNKIISQLSDYQFVILDSRAGYDDLISATHQLSTVSICVEEQDPISKLTADNLVAQLAQDTETPIFRLINKARGFKYVDLIEQKSTSVTDLGIVPFDMDIMDSFGSKDFWYQVSRSLYKWALAQAWNRLSNKLQLHTKLYAPRVSPIANEQAEMRIGFLGYQNRILFIYGLTMSFSGIIYSIWGKELFEVLLQDPTRLISLVIGIAGLAITLFSIMNKR